MLRFFHLIYYTVYTWIEKRNDPWDAPKLQATLAIFMLSLANLVPLINMQLKHFYNPKGILLFKLEYYICFGIWGILCMIYFLRKKQFRKIKREYLKLDDSKKEFYRKVTIYYIVLSVVAFFVLSFLSS